MLTDALVDSPGGRGGGLRGGAAVGVDAATGVVRSPRMRTEMLDAAFLPDHEDAPDG